MRAFALAAALLVAAASPSLANSNASSFTLQDPAKTPSSNLVIDGASWRCGSDNICVGTGGSSQPAPRACRRVASRVGALASFTYKGAPLSAEQLAACNASVAA